jgi:septum formation protein
LILASGSPRRRQLLELIGLPHLVIASQVEEIPNPTEGAESFALRVALDKALEVSRGRPDLPVLGADTVVEVDGRLLGKPSSTAEAADMLEALSGRSHRVHTALALVAGNRQATLIDTATVHFFAMTRDQVRWYVDTGEPLDKAGAYAVQGIGGLFVRGVEGSPHTVVGLPIHRLPDLWTALGLDLWKELGAGTRPEIPAER